MQRIISFKWPNDVLLNGKKVAGILLQTTVANSLKKGLIVGVGINLVDIRKIYGVEYQGEIHAVMCFAYTNEVPRSVNELEKLSTDAFLQSAMRDQKGGQIAIAYTVWSKKKGGGKLIVKEVFKKIKKSNHLNRLVTLSPLTEMAKNFHERNGAKLIQINENTQNFEYKVI